MPRRLLLDTPPDLIKGIAGKLDDVERVHDFHSIRQLLDCRSLEPRETVHRNDFDSIAPGFRGSS